VRRFTDTFDGLIALLVLAGEIIVAILCLHIVAEIAANWLFSSPIDGTTSIVSRWYMIPLVFLPMAYIERQNGHISADIFTRRLGPRASLLLDAVIALSLVCFCALFVWQTVGQALEATRANEQIELVDSAIPVWPTRWFVPLGFFTMGLAALLTFCSKVSGGLPSSEKLKDDPS